MRVSSWRCGATPWLRCILLTDALIIVACIVGALVFLFVVTQTYCCPARKESNDFTGAVVAVIGTTYAVILAFMLSGVWNHVSAGADQRGAGSQCAGKRLADCEPTSSTRCRRGASRSA